MLLGPLGVGVFLPALGWRPVDRRDLLLNELFLFRGHPLAWYGNDAGIDHLATAGDIAVLVELAIDRGKDGFAGVGGDQTSFEGPNRGAIRDLAAVTQADETLKAQAIEQLECCPSCQTTSCYRS